MEDIQRYLAAEQDCVRLIAQFLLHNDFNTSLPIFIEEAISLEYKISEEELNKIDHIKREDINKLTSAFQSSDHIQFFKAWADLVPATIKEMCDYKKLTFYLHVHFAVIPFRNKTTSEFENVKTDDSVKDKVAVPVGIGNRSKMESITRDVARLDVIEESISPCVEYDTDSLDQSRVAFDTDNEKTERPQGDKGESAEEPALREVTVPETGMEALKFFLAAEGETYSPQQEFLPFFALPYVPNPDEHPSFISLFQEKWLQSLNDRFYEFVHRYSCGVEVAPKLAKLCEKSVVEESKERGGSGSQHSLNPSELARRYKQTRRRFSKLHKDHQSLIGVAAELTAALENSVRGQAVDLKATLNNCALIFPELFTNSSSSKTGSPQGLKMLTVEPLRSSKLLCCSELDVSKIKNHLLNGSMKTKLLLLQAIRWRITKGSSEERDQAVVWLSRHDLLSVHSNSGLVASMLQPADTVTPHPLQQTLSRLLSAVASLRVGRDYLASSHSLLALLTNCLKQETNVRLDSVTSDMLLATLQKLSLRRSPRLLMIEQSMVEWLVVRLRGECARLYSLEYSTALLLNLCLHVEARERCPDSVLKLLTDLLDTGQFQIVPTVAGSLYCLLSHDRLNQAARQMDLESVLTQQLSRFSNEPQLLRQIQTLLRLLRGDLPTESVQAAADEPSEDDLDDPENLESELDAEDPVKAVGDDQCGEALLQNEYRRIFPSHGVVCPHRVDAEISIQPTTPRSRPPTIDMSTNQTSDLV